MDSPPAMRIDKWLWAARAFKTRSLAATACDGGKVDLNGEAAKPAKQVRGGVRVEITIVGGRRILKVLGLSERRGPAPEARLLYEDLTPPAPPRARQPKPPYRVPGTGRPTKRERRAIDRLRGFEEA
jgi:ribosome-associated heat shock protein Hsp15